MCVIFLFFFFQAEDGIRDLTVTGVQTCALPICSAAEGAAEVLADLDGRDKEILLERSADVLKAFEHLAFKALRLEPAYHEKIHIDCGGDPPPRFAGIKGAPRGAAEPGQQNKTPLRPEPHPSAASRHL